VARTASTRSLPGFSGEGRADLRELRHHRPLGIQTLCDLSSQAQAQDFFEEHGGPAEDPHPLDADGDGIAGVSNPCPCRGPGEGGGGGGGGRKPDNTRTARVIRAIDGDTIEVRVRRKKRDVRLIGIALRRPPTAPPRGRQLVKLRTRVFAVDRRRCRDCAVQMCRWRSTTSTAT
jgi:hypothetical protein